MSKNLLLGTILGGAATYVAWKCLSDKQKKNIKENVGSYVSDFADASTDYALNALDIIDEKLAESEASDKLSGLGDRFTTTADKVKDKANKVVDHFTNDEFDQQTADIREQLAKSADPDIVIDATSSSDEADSTDEKEAAPEEKDKENQD